jgi:hypothetical protein
MRLSYCSYLIDSQAGSLRTPCLSLVGEELSVLCHALDADEHLPAG